MYYSRGRSKLWRDGMGNIMDFPDNANASYYGTITRFAEIPKVTLIICQQFNLDFALPVFTVSKYLNSSVFGCFRFVETL